MKKVILITWASAGMWKDMATTFAKEWHIVYGAARRVEKMQDIIDAWGHALQMDVTIDEHLVQAVDQIISEQWRIDVLINNAWFSMAGAVEEVSMEDARYQMDVNLFGLARLTQLVLPHMRQQQSWRILNVSSIGGKVWLPLWGRYHASKFAIEGLSDCLRGEVAQFGIDVVVIEPGAIKTDFGDVLADRLWDKYTKGPYADFISTYKKALKKFNQPGQSSDPSVITDIARKAILAKKPKTRYHAGKFSTTMLVMRRLFSDRMMDRIWLSMFT